MKKSIINVSIILCCVMAIIFGKGLKENVIAVSSNDSNEINKQYEGVINTELYHIEIIQSTKGDNYISGKIYIAEWIDDKCLTPSTTPKITLKSTDGTYSEIAYIDYLGGIEYYFDKNIEKIDTKKEYYLEVELTNQNNISIKDKKIQKAKITQKGIIGKETNGNYVKITNGNIYLSKEHKGVINTDLYKIGVIQSTVGDNYISGRIYIAEWIESQCLKPCNLPKITLKSTDGTYSENAYVDYLGGIEYYFDKNIEGIDIKKEYYLEVKLTDKDNLATEEEQTQTAKIRQKNKIGTGTNGVEVTVNTKNNIILKNPNLYKGSINTELYKIEVIQSTLGENYISGKICIAEWVNNKCLTPSRIPRITLKSTDGTYSQKAYIDYLGGIEYYFDKNIENIDMEKEYYLEVELTNPNNLSEKNMQIQRAKITKNGTIGRENKGQIVSVENNIIKLGWKYYGAINTDLYDIDIIKSTIGENYVSGRIYIAEWINSLCLKPNTKPRIILKSTDGSFSEDAYVDYLGGIEYYFDKNIENIDKNKEYYLEVKLTDTNNLSDDINKTQTAKIRQNGKIENPKKGTTIEIYNNIMKFKIAKMAAHEEGTYGITGLKEAGDSRGSNLKYIKVGNGPNVFFATFAIHGYEDLWDRDGVELINIANELYEMLLYQEEIAQKWTIYIFPGINMDGINYGYTNNGPGRTTLHSNAKANKGIDLNRCWQIGNSYTKFTTSRNYNGTAGFQACEARYLRDFLLTHKSSNGQNVLVDLHGWTQQLIGNETICSYYQKQFPENSTSSVGRYGTGYLINWARTYLGSNVSSAKTALIELPNYSNSVRSHEDVVNNNFANRYVQSTLDMLKHFL